MRIWKKKLKRLLRKMVRLYDGQTEEFLLNMLMRDFRLTVEEQNQRLKISRLGYLVLKFGRIQRIKNGEEHVFF